MPGVATATYAERPALLGAAARPSRPLPHSVLRTGHRLAEQFVSNALYGAL